MDNLEELRKNYYRSIQLLYDRDEIIGALPDIYLSNFDELISGIVSEIDEELEAFSDPESLAEFAYEIEWLNIRKNICLELIEKKKSMTSNNEEDDELDKGRKIVLALGAGGVFIERDLKSVPHEYYDHVLECLDIIKRGPKDWSEGHKYQAGHFSCSVYESKDWQVRAYYRHINDDVAYLMMLEVKKDDSPSQVHEKLANRVRNTNNDYNEVSGICNDPVRKEKLLKESEDAVAKIESFLNENKRGR